MAILNFDANTVAPDTGGFEALPAGWYKVMMEASEMKPTKTNAADGSCYLECKYKILDGAHAGKSVFGRMNLRNSNAQAQEIAYKQLSAICHATGVLQVQDSAQLHNIPLQIKLKLREARKEHDAQGNVIKEYEASNDITAYKNINEQVGTPAVGGFPAPQAPSFMAPPAAPQFAPAAPQFAPPMQAPQFAQAPAQFAPAPMAPAAPAAPQWQPPATQQPWQAQQQAPAAAQQTPQFAPAPVQQAPVQQQQAPQQFAPAPAPAANPAAVAQTATPPWMQQQAPQA